MKSGSCGTVGCADPNRPADTDYDLLGPDLYNYYEWHGAPWRLPSYDTNLGTSSTAGLIALAELHKKHLIMPEMGTHPGCPGGYNSATTLPEWAECPSDGTGTGTKDAWFQDLASKMTSNSDYQTWILGFIYFNVITSGVQQPHDWQFVNRQSSLNTESPSACPPAVGTLATCWNGNYSSTDSDPNGWGNFVSPSTSFNNGHGDWFVGGTGPSGRSPLYF